MGGDYYDITAVDPRCYCVVVADVSGKGVGSALLASLLQGALITATGVPEGLVRRIVRLNQFLLDRTGYMRQLEQEDTPESAQRMENLRELINAALDSRDRGETLDQFLDHAALVSDAAETSV